MQRSLSEASSGAMHRARESLIPIIALVILTGALAGFVWFLAHGRIPGMQAPTAEGAEVTVRSGVGERLRASVDRSRNLAVHKVDQPLPQSASGRWDPFATLLPEHVDLTPVAQSSRTGMAQEVSDEPASRRSQAEGADGAHEQLPEPPKVTLTGVISADDVSIAVINVNGEAMTARVGDSPFSGAVVTDIQYRSMTLCYMGRDMTYELGGERK